MVLYKQPYCFRHCVWGNCFLGLEGHWVVGRSGFAVAKGRSPIQKGARLDRRLLNQSKIMCKGVKFRLSLWTKCEGRLMCLGAISERFGRRASNTIAD